MPGKILKVLVTEGQAVKAGENLMMLEAMKMQNEILADTDGTVKAINVQAGQTVANDVQGEVLVALHRQGVAQPLQVRLRIATVPIANTVRADESLTLEIANL